MKRSLQLFDAAGVTLVKIVFRAPQLGEGAFRRVVQALRERSQETPSVESAGPVDAVPAKAHPLRRDVLAGFLRRAAELSHPLRIRVANAGVSLECATSIQRIKRSSRAPWINVLDPQLDLHLYEARIQAVTHAQDCATLSWLADDGTEAFTTGVTEAFAAWVLATNGLPEPALQA